MNSGQVKDAVKNVIARFKDFKRRYFPERQLFLRSEGRVSFITFGSYTQMTITLLIIGTFLWGTIATIGYMTRDAMLLEKDQHIATISDRYKNLSGDLSSLEQEIDARTKNLEKRQQLLEELAGIEMLDPTATTAAADVTDSKIATEDTKEVSAELSAADKNTISNKGSDKDKSNSNKVESNNKREAKKAATKKAETPKKQEKSKPQSKPNQQNSFIELHTHVSESFSMEDLSSNTIKRQKLIERLDLIEDRQRVAMAKMIVNMDNYIVGIDQALAKTKITTKDVMFTTPQDMKAVGGPYIKNEILVGIKGTKDEALFDKLLDRYTYIQSVNAVIKGIPLGEPADKYYISSKYGFRRDPFKKTWVAHRALDLAGWPGNKILAAAPGIVIRSGWGGVYGKMIEIDHGNGFRTKYGHMRKLRVKKGQSVQLGQHIGDMGSTGRSTSTHLHYEVWYKKDVIDPLPFIEARENVYKIKRSNPIQSRENGREADKSQSGS